MEQTLPGDLAEIYPFQSRFFKVVPEAGNSIPMHYVDEGEGEPILLVHGNPTWSFYYRNLINHFSKTHRVVAPDHIGSGLSAKPSQYPYRLENHINNLSGLVRHLDLQNVTLVVHDWGGPIGLGWAVQHAHLIKRLVILNTAAFKSEDLPKRIQFCRVPWLGEYLMRQFNAFAGMAIHMATQKGLSKLIRKGYLYPYSNYRNRIGIARFVQDIPLRGSHPSYQSLIWIERNLERLRCPKLIMWGEKDFCFHPGFRRRWEEIFPEAEVVKFDDSGHYVLEDSPEETIQSMQEFIARNS